MSEPKQVNPHRLVVSNGLQIKALKSRISKLDASIAILETRKAHTQEVQEMTVRRDAMLIELQRRRELQEHIQRGYREFEEYAAKHGHYPVTGIVSNEDGDRPDDSGEAPDTGGSEGNQEEARPDSG